MDWGLLGAVGQGLSQGVDSYQSTKQRAEDNAIKKRAQQIQMLGAGVQENEGGDLELNPEKQAEQSSKMTQFKTAEDARDSASPYSQRKRSANKSLMNAYSVGLGDKTITDDMSGEEADEALKYSKEMAARETAFGKATIAGKFGVDKAEAGMNYRDVNMQQRLDNQNHGKVVTSMKNDKTVNDAVTRATNMANVINNVEKTGIITANDMADVQTIAVANMGIQGGGGVHERAERYAKSLGMNSAKIEQFLTGKPVDIGKDNPLYDRYKQIMQMEYENFKDRVGKRLDVFPKTYGSMYSRRKDFADDVAQTKEAILGQLPSFGQKAQPGDLTGSRQPGLINQDETPPAAELKPGARQDGYEYLGGDPKKPESWKMVQ